MEITARLNPPNFQYFIPGPDTYTNSLCRAEVDCFLGNFSLPPVIMRRPSSNHQPLHISDWRTPPPARGYFRDRSAVISSGREFIMVEQLFYTFMEKSVGQKLQDTQVWRAALRHYGFGLARSPLLLIRQ